MTTSPADSGSPGARILGILAAERMAAGKYQRLATLFPAEPCLEQCHQDHRTRAKVLEQWLHRQGFAPTAPGGPCLATPAPVDSFPGKLDVALACVAAGEDDLLERYRDLTVEAHEEGGDLPVEELLTGQRVTMQALRERRRHSLLVR
jgi:hypothetical protein